MGIPNRTGTFIVNQIVALLNVLSNISGFTMNIHEHVSRWSSLTQLIAFTLSCNS